MFFIASSSLSVLVFILLIPAAVFAVQVVAGCIRGSGEEPQRTSEKEPRVAILIPAHDERAGISATIQDLLEQLRPGDRLVVVADNCTDDTASVAAHSGAEVIIRNDPTKVGKGYALDWGVRFLANDPPDVVIVVDADCRVRQDAVANLSRACGAFGRPIQALYLMNAPTGASINQQVAQFAWRVKNFVRPLGLLRLNLPCQLMGTGMAFPWSLIRSANLATISIVEDMQLGLDLASQGKAPVFCPSAVVTSIFPASHSGARVQRQRWEQGHISLILGQAPKLLALALKKYDLNLLAIATDLLVPPLSLLIALLGATCLVGVAAAVLGGGSLAARDSCRRSRASSHGGRSCLDEARPRCPGRA